MTCEPVGFVEIAELLGVSRQRVHQLMSAYDDFPAPLAELAMGRVWARQDVEAWADSHPRKPGRRRAKGATTAADSEGNAPPGGGGASGGGAQRAKRRPSSTTP